MKIMDELKPLHLKIDDLDREILNLSPVDELNARGQLLDRALDRKSKSKVLEDPRLSKAFLERSDISREIARRRGSGWVNRLATHLIVWAVVVVAIVIYKLFNHA